MAEEKKISIQEWAHMYRPRLSEIDVSDRKVVLRFGDFIEDWRMEVYNVQGRTIISVAARDMLKPTVEPVTLNGSDPLSAFRNELNTQLHLVRDAVYKLENHIGNLNRVINTVLLASGIYMYDSRINNEDIGLVDLANYVSREHNIYNWRGVLHYRTKIDSNNLEYDFVIVGKTLRGWERVVGIEMKETDFPKAVHQAILRQPYVHYQYVAIKLSPYSVINNFWDAFVEAKENGIGVITVTWDGRPSVLLKAKFTNSKETIYSKVAKWIGRKEQSIKEEMNTMQKKIFDFIEKT